MPIGFNGSRRNGMGSGMPQMGRAFAGWTQKITLVRRRQVVADNGFVTDQDFPLSFEGTIQPLTPRQIALKPEGQRSWTWLQVHCLASELDLKNNDRVIWNGDVYKVMGLLPYQLNNFIEYHLCRDFQNGGTV